MWMLILAQLLAKYIGRVIGESLLLYSFVEEEDCDTCVCVVFIHGGRKVRMVYVYLCVVFIR